MAKQTKKPRGSELIPKSEISIPQSEGPVKEEVILTKIHVIRGVRVMIDADLAALFGVTTGNFNKGVKRNLSRFPDDFMFQLTKAEFDNLMFQIGISSWGGTRKLPYVFTEQGVAMLASVLNSELAIRVNIQIIRVFTKLRHLFESQKEILQLILELNQKGLEHDRQLLLIFDYLNQLEQAKQQEQEFQERRRIGFKTG